LAQRPAGKAYAGYWEFPGGKVEPGESAPDAMRRELHEELGIDAGECYPWLTRDFDYEHASVRLRFQRIFKWRGELHGREGQQFAWQSARALTVSPILPANGPILRALELPAVYGISNAAELGREEFLRRLRVALSRGLRLIQLREKQLPFADLHELALQVVGMAHASGARVIINTDVDLAKSVNADGVHLTAAQLSALTVRPGVDWVGASCHDANEIERAIRLGADFLAVGPVLATPTHPGAATLGWEALRALIDGCRVPVYALGGMRSGDLESAMRAGAHGVAMLRGAWED
ncbi:MAG TPA: Nudix family hydrolase, partial [Burkholderiales bacterium]|nr:Nudix family hydrolase [Burkholderiales bacterium]